MPPNSVKANQLNANVQIKKLRNQIMNPQSLQSQISNSVDKYIDQRILEYERLNNMISPDDKFRLKNILSAI
jgi:hypothetical protein